MDIPMIGTTRTALLYSCSGASNVGQVANEACRRLAFERGFKMACLAGIGAHVPGMVRNAEEGMTIAVDGCPVCCARKALEHVGVAPHASVVVTHLGIQKDHDLDIGEDEVDIAVRGIKTATGSIHSDADLS
jgi:uncharacterized metal-binding protein